jgi:hypothetical protein
MCFNQRKNWAALQSKSIFCIILLNILFQEIFSLVLLGLLKCHPSVPRLPRLIRCIPNRRKIWRNLNGKFWPLPFPVIERSRKINLWSDSRVTKLFELSRSNLRKVTTTTRCSGSAFVFPGFLRSILKWVNHFMLRSFLSLLLNWLTLKQSNVVVAIIRLIRVTYERLK